MLSLQISTQGLRVASRSPHAGYYFAVALVPGTAGDVLLLGPSHYHSTAIVSPSHHRQQFFLGLHAAHDNRQHLDLPAVLGPRSPDSGEAWDRAIQTLRSYNPPVNMQVDPCILQVSVFEYLSATMPRNINRIQIDPMVEQGLRTLGLSSDDMKMLPTALLSSRRIGHVVLTSTSLHQVWRSGRPAQFSLPLDDINSPTDPIHRGNVHISVRPYLPDIPPAVADRLRRLVLYAGDPYAQATETLQQYYDAYIQNYLRPFPPFDLPFKRVNNMEREAITFQVVDDQRVAVGGSTHAFLKPDKNDMNNIHMPTARIDGLPAHVPIHWLFQSVSDSSAHTLWHQNFYGALCDNICRSLGTTSVELANTIHAYLDRPPSAPTMAILAAARALGMILTQTSADTTYRSDFVISGVDHPYGPTISATEDVSRDLITCVTSSGDCEDASCAVHGVHTTLLQGAKSIQSATDWQTHDVLWTHVYASAGFRGGWSHPGLDALQRLLTNYAVVNILGTVTAAFPGEDRAPATNLVDIDAAERAYVEGRFGHPGYNEIHRYLYDSEVNQQTTSEAHRWALGLPLRNVLHMTLASVSAETSVGSQRHPQDAAGVERLKALLQHVPSVPLPSITLEGTTPMDPFCVVGASHWLAHDPAAQRDLREIEANARKRAVVFRQQIFPHWHKYGATLLDGGSYRHLPGNLATRQGSQFYSRALQLDAWILSRLTGDLSLTTLACTHGLYGGRWGIPVDRLLQPTLSDDLHLMVILHRIPYGLRQTLDDASRHLVRRLIPMRLGDNPPSDPDIILPVSTTTTTTLEAVIPLGLDSFRHSIYYLNGSIALEDGVRQGYQRTVTSDCVLPHYTFQQKLYGLGHLMLGIAVKDL